MQSAKVPRLTCIMNEVFPVLYGCCLGLFCSFVTSRGWRRFCWLGMSALFGLAATVLTGEWKIGWEFLLVDIPLVAASSYAVIVLRNKMKRRIRASE
jgi:hypothetical protein